MDLNRIFLAVVSLFQYHLIYIHQKLAECRPNSWNVCFILFSAWSIILSREQYNVEDKYSTTAQNPQESERQTVRHWKSTDSQTGYTLYGHQTWHVARNTHLSPKDMQTYYERHSSTFSKGNKQVNQKWDKRWKHINRQTTDKLRRHMDRRKGQARTCYRGKFKNEWEREMKWETDKKRTRKMHRQPRIS